jgi:hypothetical protein
METTSVEKGHLAHGWNIPPLHMVRLEAAEATDESPPSRNMITDFNTVIVKLCFLGDKNFSPAR